MFLLHRRLNAADSRSSSVFPFPCIRGYNFIKLASSKVSVYRNIVEAGKKGDTIYLDIGCCRESNEYMWPHSVWNLTF